MATHFTGVGLRVLGVWRGTNAHAWTYACMCVRILNIHSLPLFLLFLLSFLVFITNQVSVKYLWTRCDRMSRDRCNDL